MKTKGKWHTWKNALKWPHLANLILLAILIIAGALRLSRYDCNVVSPENLVLFKEEQTVSKNGTITGCNIFSGRWVYDDVSYPLYKDRQCSFMENDFACEKYGRKNLKYQHWRWQPHQCELPRFNGTAFLEKLRGKTLLYVGDSLNRNQWISMLCLIDSSLPPSSNKSLNLGDSFHYFHSLEYNASIGFYWAPFLVESNNDHIFYHGWAPTIRINSIEKHGRHWIGADILVFDSFAWWALPNMTILWGSFESPDAIYKKVGLDMKLRRYEIALNTWSDWLEMHINRNKTKIFFMGPSPFHFEWGHSMRRIENCKHATEPILDKTYWPSSVNPSMMQIVESVLEKLEQRGLKVEYFNITELSGYREDAHPSIYREFPGIPKERIYKNMSLYSDCLHWCLPGVPDVWSQILYAYLMKS